MLFPTISSAGVVALLFPSVLASVLPSIPLLPEVPWKKRGVSSRRSESLRRSNVNGPTSRGSWDGDFSIETDMDLKWPKTGKTVSYHFDITNTTLSPDGVAKSVMVINGQYPGPTIVADWGDTIQVTVKNSLTVNGTGIHWHGIRQLGTVEQDGVGGITECPIAPGDTRTYQFEATQFGSSWYHSHYVAQYADGVAGGIIIRGPATANYDIDLGILPITDWFHMPIFTVNAASLHASGPPIADNFLINGSMTSSSGGKYATTHLQPGKKHLLRFVNTGINTYVHVALDGHPFTVIAADFVPIVPYNATSLVIAVGQRYDVVIDANQPVGNYWLRVGNGGGQCDGPNANAANVKSIFSYEGASGSPNSTGAALPTGCFDETNIVPYVKTTVPQELPQRLNLSFTNTAASSNLIQWLIDGSPLLVDLKKPTLQSVIDGNSTFNRGQNVYVVGEANKWQYWVIQQASNAPPLEHPIHLHGHDFYVLASAAKSQWTGDTSKLKMDNPIRRDTATLPAGGYLVLAFESDNPGSWLMHCHIPFHISAGLGLQFLERASEIKVSNTQAFQDQCKSWAKFQDDVYPNGFDLGESGLKR